jgi:hypothetical protein
MAETALHIKDITLPNSYSIPYLARITSGAQKKLDNRFDNHGRRRQAYARVALSSGLHRTRFDELQGRSAPCEAYVALLA